MEHFHSITERITRIDPMDVNSLQPLITSSKTQRALVKKR